MSEARAQSPTPKPQKPASSTLIDVIVLCFAKSELKSLVGTDALRSVLDGAQRDLFPSPEVMALQPVYELLESQPGFDADKAVAPFCRIKQWENQLRVRVDMPHQLDVLDRKTREEKAFLCNAFDSDLDKLLAPPVEKKKVEVVEKKDDGPITTASFYKRTKIALVAALIGLAAAGVSFYLTFRKGGGNATTLQAADISTDVPIKDVRLSGNVIVATLTDPNWMTKPEATRRSDLLAATSKIRIQGANRLIVVDAKGAPLAVVVVRKDPTVTFTQQRK